MSEQLAPVQYDANVDAQRLAQMNVVREAAGNVEVQQVNEQLKHRIGQIAAGNIVERVLNRGEKKALEAQVVPDLEGPYAWPHQGQVPEAQHRLDRAERTLADYAEANMPQLHENAAAEANIDFIKRGSEERISTQADVDAEFALLTQDHVEPGGQIPASTETFMSASTERLSGATISRIGQVGLSGETLSMSYAAENGSATDSMNPAELSQQYAVGSQVNLAKPPSQGA